MFFDILYNILIYPIEFIIEILFYLFNNVFKSSYGVSLFLLSLCINFLSLPLYNIAESWQAKERAIQDKMKPMIDNIKAVYKGDQRYLLIRACQRINGYRTIYAFRGTLGLLIQIPFFMAAYNFVHSLTGLNGQSFLFIKDLSKPDALIHIGSVSINLLPFVMTLFSLLAGFVYSKKLKFKESLPLYIVSLIFLVLLYTSPSGLLFYWTINCLFSFIKNLVIEYKLHTKEKLYKTYSILSILLSLVFIILLILKKLNSTFLILFSIIAVIYIISNSLYLIKKIFLSIKNYIVSKSFIYFYNVLMIILAITFVLLLILGNIEREGYLKDFSLIDNNSYNMRVGYHSSIFKNSDIYGVIVNKDKLDNGIINIEFEGNGSPFGIVALNDTIENIGEIKVYYKLFIKSDIIFYFVLLLIICLLLNIYRFINIKLFNFNNLFSNESFFKNRNKLILLSCLVITLLSGFFIPSSLIGNSPQEFRDPFYLIFNDFSMSIGLFLFYPFFIYILFSEKIKNILTFLLICFTAIALINTFIMVGNYININADFVFDNTDLLKASSYQTILNIVFILSIILILLFILLKSKTMLIINIYTIIIIALISVSIFDIKNIIIGQNELKKINAYNSSVNTDKIFNLSKTGENIFVFILDRAIPSYWLDALERFPEYKKKLDGFTIYPNTVSLGLNTSSSIASIYAGYNYSSYNLKQKDLYDTFLAPKGVTTNSLEVNNEAVLSIPLSLEQYGYETSILEPLFVNNNYNAVDTTIFTNYKNINAYANSSFEEEEIRKYIGNINNKNLIKNIAIRFSIFRMLPINLRYSFYDDKKWFINNSGNNNGNISINTYAVLSSIKDKINITDENKKYYNSLHNMLPHMPDYFNSDFLPSFYTRDVEDNDLKTYKNDFSTRHFYCNVATLNLMLELLEFLKENDVYDNTKIIIASDHGWFVDTVSSDNLFVNWYNPLLMFKDFNSRGEVKIDTNFMTSADIPYLTTKHISNIRDFFNNDLITNDSKSNGVYMIAHPWKGNNIKFYYVKDNVLDVNNWKKFEMQKDKSMKEIPLEFDEKIWE